MFEVEKGFILNPEQEKKLIDGAEFLGEKSMRDIYYDDEKYSLTTKDIWFRNRNGRFELKIPMNKSLEERVSDQYEEIENDKDILQYFDADINKSIEDILVEKGYKPFCDIVTTRRKYKKEGFNIDLDIADFGYQIAEIECMVADASEMEKATRSIIAFAEKHGIMNCEEKLGKGTEFIRRNNPAHFQALLDAKVIKN